MAVVVPMLVAVLPVWPHTKAWGYGPSRAAGAILVMAPTGSSSWQGEPSPSIPASRGGTAPMSVQRPLLWHPASRRAARSVAGIGPCLECAVAQGRHREYVSSYMLARRLGR